MKNVFRFASLLAAAVMLFASCGETQDDGNGPVPSGELTLEVDNQIIQAGVDQARFTVKLGETVITEDVVFFDGANKVIDLGSDFVFSTDTPGDYSFWVNYKTYNSNTVKVTAVSTAVPETPEDPQPSNTSFVRRVLLTKVTGAGCSACPNVTQALHFFYYGNKDADPVMEPHELAPYTVKAEAHTFEAGYDPAQLTGFFTVSSWPTVIVDWAQLFVPSTGVITLKAIEGMVEERYEAEEAKAGISVNSICENGAVTLKVSVKAAVTAQYRVGAWLLEDNIKGQQAGVPAGNENAWYHEFDDCIRIADSKVSASNFTGHQLGLIEAGKTAEKMFTWTLKSNWVQENLELCIFVSTPDAAGRNYYVNNVIKAPVNGITAFEYAE